MSLGKPGNHHITTLIGAAALSLATPGTTHGLDGGGGRSYHNPTKTTHPTSEEPSHSTPPAPKYFIEKGPQGPQREDYPKPESHHQPLVAVLTENTGRRMNQIIERNTTNGPISTHPTRPPQTAHYPGSARKTGRYVPNPAPVRYHNGRYPR